MIDLDVAFTPSGTTADVAVVVDVLRMTTTAATLFSRGVAELLIVADVDEARRRADVDGAMLLGERHGVQLPGFEGGNSPLEYLERDVRGRRAILCTTNGSAAVESVSASPNVLLGSIVNADAVARRALELARDRIVLVCAGTEGEISADDVVGAGCIADAITRRTSGIVLTDAARIALNLATPGDAVEGVLRASRHAATLVKLGFQDDLDFAADRDRLDEVPERTGRDPAAFTCDA